MKKSVIIIAISLIIPFGFTDNSVYAENRLPAEGSTHIGEDSKSEPYLADEKSPEFSPDGENLTLLFIGDIMGHESLIRAALQPDGVTYDYSSCFQYIRDYITAADLAIANLEVTLAGPPYNGYPFFSSPDALAAACKDAGIDVLVTATNHCVDMGKKGLERTIEVLDSLNILHTGTFLSYSDKQQKTPLIIEKKSFKIAIINYTYDTNEIPVPEPSYVNLIKISRLKADIAASRSASPDAVILFIHWGIEYQNKPDARQLELAEICFNSGADIIIGSHPHVLQKSIWINRPGSSRFVAYSLGNFISNQKTAKTDGGQMIQLTLSRKNGITSLSEAKYILTWIYGPGTGRNKKFYILPCRDFENRPEFFASPEYYNRMKGFIRESRKLLDNQNENVKELK